MTTIIKVLFSNFTFGHYLVRKLLSAILICEQLYWPNPLSDEHSDISQFVYTGRGWEIVAKFMRTHVAWWCDERAKCYTNTMTIRKILHTLFHGFRQTWEPLNCGIFTYGTGLENPKLIHTRSTRKMRENR